MKTGYMINNGKATGLSATLACIKPAPRPSSLFLDCSSRFAIQVDDLKQVFDSFDGFIKE
jgi:hypothetical protein